MTDHRSWLRAEIERWQAEGLITSDLATTLLARYPAPRTTAWGPMVFAALAATVAGLGVVLILAHNWAEIPRLVRLGLIVGAVLACHWGASLCLRHGRAAASTGLGLLGTMLFGAGIMLVAQMYHIEGHWPNGVLLWACGATAIAWARPCPWQGALAAVLAAVTACGEAGSFSDPASAALALILVGLLPLAWRLRSALLLGVALPSMFLAAACAWGCLSGISLVTAGLISLSGAALAAGRLTAPTWPAGATALAAWGWSVFLVFLGLLCFHEPSRELLRHSDFHGIAWLAWLLPLAAALGAWGVLAWRWLQRQARSASGLATAPTERPDGWETALAVLPPLTTALVQVAIFLPREGAGSLIIPFNLIFLMIALAFLRRGAVSGGIRPALIGSLMISGWALGHFVDLFESLLLRGAVFILLGAGLALEGWLVASVRRKRQP